MSTKYKLDSLDVLRGFASLAVCWFHFTQGNVRFLPDGFLKATGSYGWLGVEIFFVISGFVIPYSLHRSEYKLRDYPTFIIKRIIRLDPPYLVSILIVLTLLWLSALVPGFKGGPVQIDAAGLLLHFGYLNALVRHQWLNPVYWTLAIEFQYYLLIGLLFPFLNSAERAVRLTMLLSLAALPFVIPNENLIFRYLFLFLLGFGLFQFRTGLTGRLEMLCLEAVFGVGLFITLGMPPTVAATFAIVGSVVLNFKNKVFRFLANISYSLYLLHVPIGGRIVNIGQRFAANDPERYLVLIMALAVSIVSAFLLYRFIERPARDWAASISYTRRNRATATELA